MSTREESERGPREGMTRDGAAVGDFNEVPAREPPILVGVVTISGAPRQLPVCPSRGVGLNAVQLIGWLTYDPEADQASEGRTVATFRIAVDRVGQDGADFVTVKVWGRLADAVVQHLARGRRVAVQGRLHHDEWTGSDGARRSHLLVVARRVEFLESGRARARSDDLEGAESAAPAVAH